MRRLFVVFCFTLLASCMHPQPPSMTNTVPSLFVLPPEWTPTGRSELDRTVSAISSATLPSESRDGSPSASTLTDQALSIMKQGGYSLAAGIWGQILQEDPQNAEAYYQRATCYYYMSEEKLFLDLYIGDLDQALRDIDTAISIRGDDGDYYSLRQLIYIGILSVMDVEVDREYMANIALDNARKAYSLGTTIEPYPDRIIITDLLFTNQCQTALDELQLLLDETPVDDSSRGGLLSIQSQAFSCLGRVEDAIDAINESMSNHMNMDWKKWLKSVYLYHMEKYDDSLKLINEVVYADMPGVGERLYFRAAICLARGEISQARSNLESGKARTWLRHGMLPYVEAQLSLQEGDTDTAIQLLLYAETTFEPFQNPQRRKIQKQLAAFGVTPLDPTPSISHFYPATPIP
jgi:tetratricopeptide (TPR) repeat protein